VTVPAELAVTAVLPPATAGEPYSARLTASGGVPPYTWEAEGLPPALELAGDRIWGTVADYGLHPVTVTVTDAVRATAFAGLLITAAPDVPLPPGADPALAYRRTDVEWIVYLAVKDLGGTVDWALWAEEGDPRAWITTSGIQVDVRAATKALAADRADEVRRVVAALPWAPGINGVIAAVDVIGGPWWEPDPDGRPRYVVRFAVTTHPPRRAGARVPAGAGHPDPVLRYARPAVELAARDAVRNLGGTVTWCFAATEGQPRGWLSVVDVQVDVRANSKSAAWRRADACRRAIKLMPWGAHPHGVIARVDVTDGPFWLPDPRPRYVARYAVWCHPRRPANLPDVGGV
jgi:hypothetical protein